MVGSSFSKIQFQISWKLILKWLLLVYLIPKFIYQFPSVGLDPSWTIGLNLALNENLIWGKDVVFTYGPLGYLLTGLPLYASKVAILLFYFFIAGNGIYFVHYILRAVGNSREYLYSVLILFFFGNFLFSKDAISLYFYSVFHMLHYIKHKNLPSLLLVWAFALITFFAKVNTGILISFIFFFYQIFITYYFGKSWIRLIKFAGVYIFLIISLAKFLHVDLLAYLANSLEIINGYNDAMVIKPTLLYPFLAISFVWAILVAFAYNFKNISKSVFEISLNLNVLGLLFISFKQSFVRADGHMLLFFESVLFIISLPLMFSNLLGLKYQLKSAILLISFLTVSFYPIDNKESLFNSQIHFKSLYNTLSNLHFVEDELNRIKNRNVGVLLPSNIKNMLHNHSVDVLGYEISSVYFNQLKYNPRPVFQSYCAYTPNLIQLNSQKYMGPDAPEFVIFHFGSIDDRHPLWDEPQTYLSLLEHYTIIDTFSFVQPETENHSLIVANGLKGILFKKRNDTSYIKKVGQSILKDTIVQFGSDIKIPSSSKTLYLEMESEYSLLGKLRRIIFQPSLMYIELTYENGEIGSYRLVKPIMEVGVLINQKVLSLTDAHSFFLCEGKSNMPVKSFKLIGSSVWFKDSFRIRYVEYDCEN